MCRLFDYSVLTVMLKQPDLDDFSFESACDPAEVARLLVIIPVAAFCELLRPANLAPPTMPHSE